MDQLGRVLVLMSVNHCDSAPSHKAVCCVHLKVQKKNKKFVVGVAMLLNFYTNSVAVQVLFNCY